MSPLRSNSSAISVMDVLDANGDAVTTPPSNSDRSGAPVVSVSNMSPASGMTNVTVTRADLAFASPRKLPKADQLKGRVVVLDVAFASEASGGGFAKLTKPFIDKLGARLAGWVDHHDHLLHE